MLIDERIDEVVFDRRRKSLELELLQLKQSTSKIDDTRKDKIQLVEDIFNFVSKAANAFKC